MTDKMREEFETWAKRKWNGISLLRVNQPGTPRDGQYEAQAAKDCWEAWQASRAVIRVDLPHLFPFYREGVTEALLEHGIKVNQWGSK